MQKPIMFATAVFKSLKRSTTKVSEKLLKIICKKQNIQNHIEYILVEFKYHTALLVLSQLIV